MQNKTEQTAVPSEFRLFRGREKPRNSVPNNFSEEKNPRNFILNHFSVVKTFVILFRTISWKKKPLEFRSEPFFEREKPTEFCSEPVLDENNL
jgi:hypothetical protein